MAETLTFYYDYISHNAYLAWDQVGTLCKRHGLALEPVPVLFGAMLKANGQLGPAEIPPKSLWMIRDVLRKARRLNLPIAPPHAHPFNPLLALRASSSPLGESRRNELTTALFDAAWRESRDITEPAVVAAVASGVGLDGEAIVADAASPATKALLTDRTEAAIAAGVFGVPSMHVRGELFWGFDDLIEIERFLAEGETVPAAELAPWLEVRPSIVRRRG
jgi:2-hydroxychromene-2-carboxylate isomerase